MPQKSSGSGYGGQRSGGLGSNFGGGSGRMGGGNRPSGPDQVAQYSGIRPNGQYPNVGVTGGLYGLGRSIFTGDAYGQYGEPDMPAADISTRDSTPGALRGNTGGRDFGMAMAGQGMPNWIQNAIAGLRLRGMTDAQLGQTPLAPFLPKPAAGLLAAAPQAPQAGPGLKYNPTMSTPKFIGDTTPGLKPYGYMSQPFRYFA